MVIEGMILSLNNLGGLFIFRLPGGGGRIHHPPGTGIRQFHPGREDSPVI